MTLLSRNKIIRMQSGSVLQNLYSPGLAYTPSRLASVSSIRGVGIGGYAAGYTIYLMAMVQGYASLFYSFNHFLTICIKNRFLLLIPPANASFMALVFRRKLGKIVKLELN